MSINRRPRSKSNGYANVSAARPFGDDAWTRQTAQHLNLAASLRPLGRPRKNSNSQTPLFPDLEVPD